MNARYFIQHKNKLWLLKTMILCLLLAIYMPGKANDNKIEIARSTLSQISGKYSHDTLFQSLKPIFASDNINEKKFLWAVIEMGNRLRQYGQTTKAIEIFASISHIYESKEHLSTEEQQTLTQLYIPLGAAHEEIGLQDKAMSYYLTALSLAEQLQSERLKAIIFNNIGALYLKKGDTDKALSYLEQAIAINKANKYNQELFYNYNNIGAAYIRKNQKDKTLDYALQAIQLIDKEKEPYLYYFMQSNIASLYLDENDFYMASSYLRNAMKHQEKFGFSEDLSQTYSLMSELFMRTHQTDSALFYMNKSLRQAQSTGNSKIESERQIQMARIQAFTGQYHSAYQTLLQAVTVKDSLQTVDNSKRLSDMEHLYDIMKDANAKEVTIQNLLLQKENTQRLWIITASLALLLAACTGLLIYRARNKEKERKIQHLLATMKTDALQQEKEMQQQKEEELKQVIDQRNRELTAYTLHHMKTSEFVADVTEDLKQLLLELNPKDRAHRARIQEIKTKLQQFSSTSDNNEFFYYFEQVHPSFYKNLETSFPDLTDKEKRLCAFLRLGLSSKEIAAITFKEIRSVESARARLRKKLNLDADEKLTSFLSSF